jgi:hypothetical protein
VLCQRSGWQATHPAAAPAPPARAPQERVTDHDRSRTAAMLTRAYGDGVIAVEELDAALAAAYGARTVAELDAATEHLPAAWKRQIEAADARDRRLRTLHAARSAAVRSYAGVMTLLVGIWLTVGITAGAWYPWPVWPALGWGVPLLLTRGQHHGRAPNPASPY